jgi:hypothetical protein
MYVYQLFFENSSFNSFSDYYYYNVFIILTKVI